MLGFHSQNVLQILENMKPIIFRINVTDEGEITFNKVEGMTNSQAYELMLRNGYGKEGDEPIIPIIRVSYEEVGAGYDYTMDFIATPVIGFVTPENVLSRIVMDLIHGSIDGIKLVMDLTALRSPSTPEGTHIVGFPYYHLDFDNQKLTIKVNNSGIQMPTDDGVQIIDYITIYANGNLDIGLLDRQ